MKRHITCNDPAVAWITIMSGCLKCWTEMLINSASAKAQGHISVFCTVVQRNIKLISFAEGADQDGSVSLPPESECIRSLPSAVVSLFTAVQLSLVGHQERRANCLFSCHVMCKSQSSVHVERGSNNQFCRESV